MNLPRALAAAAVLLLGACDHHVRAGREMQWRCAPEFRDPASPEADTVALTYAEQPDCFEVVSAIGLCRELAASGKPAVRVDFDAWGNRFSGLRGYRIEAIDGKPPRWAGGTGGSGARGTGVACPMDGLFP